MLRLIRDRLDEYRESLKKRGSDFPLERLLELDDRRRKLIQEINGLRHQKNILEQEIARKIRSGAEAIEKDKVKTLDEQIKQKENELSKVEEQINSLQLVMPNFVESSVPVGPDESYNVVVRTWGEAGKTGPDHIDIGLKLDLIDLERAAKTSGARFYYLKRDLVLSLIHI